MLGMFLITISMWRDERFGYCRAFSPNPLKHLHTVCRDRSLPCSDMNWQTIPVLSRMSIENLRIMSSHAFSWTTSLFGRLDIVKMHFSRNLRFGTTNFSCYCCCWSSSGQPAVEGFQSLYNSSPSHKSRTGNGKVRLPVK